MISNILFILLSSSLSNVGIVRSIAPGDEDVLCTREPQFAQSHPPNQRTLLDSYNYQTLFPRVWLQLDLDGEGQGWTQRNSGICRNVIQVCDFRNGSEQNNWFFTQYISYPSLFASDIFIRITYNFSKCRNNPGCDIPHFNVLHYDTDGPSPQEQVKSTNYDLIKQIEQPTLISLTTATVSFQRPSNSSGLYLAIQDVGSCGDIMQIQVYYEQCPSKIVGLVSYPALPLPAKNSLTTMEGSAVCAPNAKNSSILEFRAFSDGECERSVTCECLPGYIEEQQVLFGTALFVSQCKACAPGMYRSEFHLTCQLCPLNSESQYAASAECRCLHGYFRASSDRADSACTAPPSGCTGIGIISVTATDVLIEWKRPNLTGREDFYYIVRYKELTAFSWIALGPYVNDSDYVEYTIDGLRPSTQYVIRISVHNGVSDQDVENEQSRTCEVVVSTADIGQPRNVSGFCEVVTWRPPLSAGMGTQLGYVVRLFIPGTDRDMMIKKEAGEFYHIIKDSEKSNDMIDLYFVQVRSTIRDINGHWSAAVPLGCDKDVQMAENRALKTPVIHHAQDGFIIWNVTDMTSGSTYEIRYKQAGSQNFKVVSSNRTLLAYALQSLETDARYTVEVRQVIGNNSGNWSLPVSFQTTDSKVLVIIHHPKSANIELGDSIELTCTAKGSNPLSFIWGTTADISSAGLPPSVQTSNPDGSVTSILSITNAGGENAGEYLCIIMDSTGSRLLSLPANISVLTPDLGLSRIGISFNQSSYTFNESNRFASVGISWQGNISESISINVTAGFNGTGNVFPSVEEFNQILTLDSESETTLIVTIPFITDMIALEDPELIYLQMELISPVPDVLLVESTSVLLHVLDDTLVSIGFSTSIMSLLEGVGSVPVCIYKSPYTIIPVTVSAKTQSLTAHSETDYIISETQLEVMFGRTEGQKCFSIQIVDDSVQEGDEIFQLLISSTNPVDSRIWLDPATITVTIIDDDIASGLRFSIGGRTYPNNSVISLWNIGENDKALVCITDYTQCCSVLPYRQGEFYYPNGEKVGILGSGDGIYRTRGNQEIFLNRKKGVASPTGRFRCELPDTNGVMLSIFINISQTIISFEQASYTFSEDVDVGRVCLERSGYIQQLNEIRIGGALQEGTGQTVNEVLSFLPGDVENIKCVEITIVDDDVALERTEEWTLRLESTASQNYVLGNIQTTLVQVIDDDELTMSLMKITNVSEESGIVDICVQFSNQFVESFEMFLNTSASLGNTSVAQQGSDYTLPTPVIVGSEHSGNGKACLNLTIIDDSFAEADECLVVTVATTKTVAPVSDFFCIADNDGVQVSFQRPAYMFLESQGTVDICVEKFGFTQETIQVILFGALQQESGQTLDQTLTFSPTDSVQCSGFALVDDDLGLEEIEFLTLSLREVDLSSGQRFNLGQYNQTSIGILDDDELVLSLVKASNFTEGAGHAELCLTFNLQFVSSFTIHLSTIVSPNITIPHRATPDIDYAAIPLTLSPGVGDSRNGSLCFTFAIFDDELIEPDECIAVSIYSVPDTVRVAENGTTTIVCIIDDDQDVVIGFSRSIYSVKEDSGEIQVSVGIITGKIKRLSTVSISTVSGTALESDDYLMVAGKVLQFEPGKTQLFVSIAIVNDSTVEDMETFSAVLTTTTTGITLAPSESVIHILDNDVLIGFEHISYTVSETVGQIIINITIIGGVLTHPISIAVSTSNGTARDAADYISVATDLKQLTPDDSSAVISIEIVNDNITEVEENFTVTLTSSSPEVIVSPSSAVITIQDDDSTDVFIGFKHTSYTVKESAGSIRLTVDVVGRANNPFSISYSTLDDTANGGNDFQQRSETVQVFPPDIEVVISVQILSDNLLEGEERFSVFIASSSDGITVTQSTAQVTIVDSSKVTVEFGSSDYTVRESDGHVEVCLTLDGMALFPISFHISATENSPRDAEDGVDFTGGTNDVVLQPLTSRSCTQFTILNDNLAEAQTETFIVSFTNISDLQVGTSDRATVFITDSYGGDLYFMLNGQRIPYNSEATVDIRGIGTGENALLCVTDRTSCCSGSGRAGEWYYPDGRRVNIQGAGEDFYRNRGSRILRLNRARDVIAPTGRYRCKIPDATGTTQNIFISVTA